MQDLRLVGVHEDGEHLLLSGTGGDIFRLRIDEALRVAALRPASRTPGSRPATPGAQAQMVRLSPRDIQAQIRAGASAAEVSETSGLPLEHVQRYEGPVLAEREYIARQARAVEVSAALPTHDGYRSAFGDNPATLEEMVSHRLAAFGINPDSVSWDAWRRQDGSWTVIADFDAEAAPAGASIGENAPAQWTFSPGRRSIHNANRWAQQLSELEPLDSPLPARRLSAVTDRPFDFETDAADNEPEAAVPAAEPTDGRSDEDSLLDMLRSRRGQRLGVDEDEDDALALLLTNGVPGAHPRPDELTAKAAAADETPAAHETPAAGSVPGGSAPGAAAPEVPAPSRLPGQQPEDEDGFADPEEAGTAAEAGTPDRSATYRPLSLATRPVADDALALHEVSTQTREFRMSGAPRKAAQGNRKPEAKPAAAASGEPRPAAERNERKSALKPKRSSVPSWDEIVFGKKGD
ncbi:MAG: hypothetical protein JWO93_473 [Micrococcaceae bacterium]|nr:hypothetical protein [Micrococcaceae bacterium]